MRSLTWITLVVMTIIISILSLTNSCLAWDSPDIGIIYDMDHLVDDTEGAVTKVGNEYRVHETLNISGNDTLRLHPGSTINFAQGTGLGVFGALSVEGTSSMPVTLTSVGHTWSGIVLHPLSDATVRHLSLSNVNTSLHLDTVSGAIIENVTFNNVENGIEIIGCKDSYFENIIGTKVNDLAIRV
ncbi:MAG: hypothetical protein KAS77_07475, partial [Thermoplasmata archaeon]|nr:hypothetical protein [Thermoplasmata archaeon]